MSMACGGNARQKAEINMTPMIDVLLVLIIIFMVITPLTSRGLRAVVPQTSTDPPDEMRPSHDIVVAALADGTLLLNSEHMDRAALRARLERLYKSGATRVIFVRGEKGIEFGRVAELIDLARGAGVYHVGLMTN